MHTAKLAADHSLNNPTDIQIGNNKNMNSQLPSTSSMVPNSNQ
jgi:hypothetical protein